MIEITRSLARQLRAVLRNSYEFVTSEPVADFTGQPVRIAGG